MTNKQTNRGSTSKQAETPLHKLQAQHNADIFVVSDRISRGLSDLLIDEISAIKNKNENGLVFLCTYGGDGDAAYIIARTFERHYKKFVLCIEGFCKSAGTIIALGADKILISQKGELGPLDVQLSKEDELAKSISGLDTVTAIKTIGSEAFDLFEEFFINIITRSDASISTKTAAEIATQLTSAIISPITAQLNPLKICESHRSNKIALAYSILLGADPKIVRHLISNYPTHSFVIGFDEAKDLFNDVTLFTDLEESSSKQIKDIMIKMGFSESIRIPSKLEVAIHIKTDIIKSKKEIIKKET